MVPIGFILAMVAAGLTVSVAVIGAGPSAEATGWIVLFTAWTGTYAAAFAFLPWLVAVVVAEGFAIRSVFYWLAVGGGIGAAAYLLMEVVRDSPWAGFNLAVHLAAGFVGGFVYWFVAGRNAGFARAGLGGAGSPTDRGA